MGKPIPGVEAAIVRTRADGEIESDRDARYHGGARSQTRLAVDVPRLSRPGGALPQVLSFRLVLERRSRVPRRGRLLLVRGPRRRRHQIGRAPHRSLRGRERTARASGGGRSRRHRQAGPDGGRCRQSVRLAARGHRAERRAAPRAARARAAQARPRRRAARDRVPAEPAENAFRQDHASDAKARELGLPLGDTSMLESDEAPRSP